MYNPFTLPSSNGTAGSEAITYENQTANIASFRSLEWPLADAQELNSHPIANFNTNDYFSLESTGPVMVPFAFSEGLVSNTTALQTMGGPLTQAQNIPSRQVTGLMPTFDPAPSTPKGLAVSMTSHASAPQPAPSSQEHYLTTEIEPGSPQQPTFKQTDWIAEPKDKDWRRERPKITRLYRDQGQPLNQVIETMSRDHNFKAR